ncbi:MAG: dihydroorotate dehydrogenase electron transfer subunit [Dehalococcoidia bacterium]|jgi:dihydroorotate dehydrogenase electron transfer subunit
MNRNITQASAGVVSVCEAIPGAYLLWLESPRVTAEAKAGQFVMVACGEDTLLRRPISIHRIDGERLALLVANVGKGTGWLSQRKAGDTLDILGPLGNGFDIRESSGNVMLVAGGMGIAPLLFLADTVLESGKNITFIIGARTADCLLPVSISQKSYDAGVKPGSINVINATDDGSEGYKGPATDLIPAYMDGIDRVFACGPVEMYEAMSRIPELKGKSVQISMEIMMACGFGVCYGCTIKTKSGPKQVCKDGPVFEMGEVEWDRQ